MFGKKFLIFSAVTSLVGLGISAFGTIWQAKNADRLASIQGDAAGRAIVDETQRRLKAQEEAEKQKEIEKKD